MVYVINYSKIKFYYYRMSGFKSLSVTAQNNNIPIKFGVSLDASALLNIDILKTARYVFDSITCENNMKPNFLRSSANTSNYTTLASYSFTNADRVYNYATSNSMKMLGHTLWYDPSNTPTFVKDLSNNRTLNTTTMNNILSNHVTNILTHYNSSSNDNTIYNWQVANEALNSSGITNTNSVAYRYNNNYVEDLYKYAQEYLNTKRLTNIKLFYNDYKDTTGQLTKLKDLKSKNILDGVGLQCHANSLDDLNTIEKMTKDLVKNGFEVHYTEIDYITEDMNDDCDQKKYFVGLLNLALKYGVKNMTFWNIKDNISWLYSRNSNGTPWPGNTKRYPTLFDSTLKPKNCYNALISLLEQYVPQAPKPAPPLNTKQSYDIFIVLGQSNSVGRGSGSSTGSDLSGNLELITRDDYANSENPNIKQWNGSTIVPAKEGLYHIEGQRNNIYGFGTSFARQYIRENKLTDGNKVLIIGCGCGGSGFKSCSTSGCGHKTWDMDANKFSSVSGCESLFELSKRRIRDALRNVGPNSIIKGILWHQGENDVTNTNYSTLAPTMLNSLRSYIVGEINKINNINQTPTSVKILMGGIMQDHTSKNGTECVRAGHNAMNITIKNIVNTQNRNNQNYGFVPSDEIVNIPEFNHKLNDKGDCLHFDKDSQIEFGKRYFYIYNDNCIKFS